MYNLACFIPSACLSPQLLWARTAAGRWCLCPLYSGAHSRKESWKWRGRGRAFPGWHYSNSWWVFVDQYLSMQVKHPRWNVCLVLYPSDDEIRVEKSAQAPCTCPSWWQGLRWAEGVRCSTVTAPGSRWILAWPASASHASQFSPGRSFWNPVTSAP